LVDFGDKYEEGELGAEEIGETSARTRIVNLGVVLIDLSLLVFEFCAGFGLGFLLVIKTPRIWIWVSIRRWWAWPDRFDKYEAWIKV